MKLQAARIELGRAGARTVELRSGRLTVAPISLDLDQVRALRDEVPEAVYESLKRTLKVPLPEKATKRLSAILHVSNALSRVGSEPVGAAS
jgi:transcription-repair coupling factor (superfamily II helicase)